MGTDHLHCRERVNSAERVLWHENGYRGAKGRDTAIGSKSRQVRECY